jgi:hypothetical protein
MPADPACRRGQGVIVAIDPRLELMQQAGLGDGGAV